MHRALGIPIFARVRGTLVKGHNNISSYTALDLHGFFWRKEMIGTIDMAFETHSFFFYLSSTGKRIYLIPSTIGEDISIPMHKLMQTSCLLQYRSSRTQVEMVGIS